VNFGKPESWSPLAKKQPPFLFIRSSAAIRKGPVGPGVLHHKSCEWRQKMYTLGVEEKVRVIGALVEGNSIRSIERMTGIHRDTIMRLLLVVGDRCGQILNERMRKLPCRVVQVDEIWTYVLPSHCRHKACTEGGP